MKNAMKKNITLIFIALAACFFSITCQDPITTEEEVVGNGGGLITISLGGGNARAADANVPWANALNQNELTHTITLSGGEGGPHTSTFSAGGGTAKFSVIPGEWTILVEAFYLNDLVAVGDRTIQINRGNNGTITIQMYEPSDFPAYTVNFESNGGSYIESQTVKKYSKAIEPTEPTQSGKYFDAWYTDNTIFHSQYDFNAAVAANITLYAQWVIKIGTGTEEDPFIVYDVATLQKVGTDNDGWSLSAHYLQIKDITLPATDTDESNWTPIGEDDDHPFIGSYDGDGHTISNLTIEDAVASYQGLFCVIGDTGTVKNIGLVNCNITGIGECSYVGGVAGSNNGTVLNCYSTGNFTTEMHNTGGVVGLNNGTVKNCYSTSDVSSAYYVGGVVGSNNGMVENCYATGDVSGVDNIGGVVGYNEEGTVQNCYATGDVSGTECVGGVVGGNNSEVKNCVALNLDIKGFRVAGLAEGELINNYGRSDMKGNNFLGEWTSDENGENGANITKNDWSLERWWTGIAFFDEDVWDFDGISATKLPKLRNMPIGVQNPVIKQ